MKIIVGSSNPVKINAIKENFNNPIYEVIGASVDSKVKAQPLSHEETRIGAINRAKACVDDLKGDLGFGLEGGIFFSEDHLYLCNWGALADKENSLYVVSGPTLRLPDNFKKPILEGLELNEAMFNLLGLQEVGSKQGAIGHFTNGVLCRTEVFNQIVKILWGQYLYDKKFSFSTN
ncbi:MAG: DUF84 family protein [Chlamydiae bacterium]|nr:DUF84 family protein [Chlamydiota bacterium]